MFPPSNATDGLLSHFSAFSRRLFGVSLPSDTALISRMYLSSSRSRSAERT